MSSILRGTTPDFVIKVKQEDFVNSTVTLYCFSNNARSLFTNGRTYTYKFVKWTT